MKHGHALVVFRSKDLRAKLQIHSKTILLLSLRTRVYPVHMHNWKERWELRFWGWIGSGRCAYFLEAQPLEACRLSNLGVETWKTIFNCSFRNQTMTSSTITANHFESTHNPSKTLEPIENLWQRTHTIYLPLYKALYHFCRADSSWQEFYKCSHKVCLYRFLNWVRLMINR